jgi:repressor LexA
MQELTRQQSRILDFIKRATERDGMPPTLAEICEEFDFNVRATAAQHLRAIKQKGYIELLPGVSRGIRLQDSGILRGSPFQLPLIGRVAAGKPILSEEHVEEMVPVDPGLFRPKAAYLRRVQGMSMRDIGIVDGDLVGVHPQADADNQQIVLARIQDPVTGDEELTLKRLVRKGAQVHLLPENSEFKPIVLTGDDIFSIEGIYAGHIHAGRHGAP